MALERTLHPEWREVNEPNRYPFADSASLADTSGQLLDPTVFLDAHLYPIGAVERVGLSRVTVDAGTITLVLGDASGQELASCQFETLAPPASLVFTDSYGRPAGLLVSEANRMAVFQTWARGDHLFLPGAAEFVASVVTPMPDVGLRGIVLEDGELFSGDIWLVGDAGVVLRDVDGSIRIDIVGDPLFRRRLCGDDARFFTTPTTLRTINGVGPTEQGEFALVVNGRLASDQLLRIVPADDHTLRIEAVGREQAG